jgi:two-component system sensor histidine kinase KdpD
LTYLLANASAVRENAQLSALANDARKEAERLNDDIQNLLDASRITGTGIQPQLQWADASDILNAALERKREKLSDHRIELDIQDDLPLVRVDPVLVEQATGQILDNAAKYSGADSLIRITAQAHADYISIVVADQGAGLTSEESMHIWDRFYRSPRHPRSTGSGLGLWIARAVLMATGGSVEAASPGPGRGTTLTIRLPAPKPDAEDVRSDE